MTAGASENAMQHSFEADQVTIPMLQHHGQLNTVEQMRGFELLRLAFFALKLRKLEQRQEEVQSNGEEYELRRSLLRHVIFQQIVTLTRLDAREQAYQLIEACRK